MNKITLRKNEEHRIKNGHLWVFSNEVMNVERSSPRLTQVEAGVQSEELRTKREELNEKIESGELVQVFDSRENFIASGFYNPNSLIAVRIFARKENVEIAEVLKSRILSAYAYRKSIYPNRNSFRLVFSESDLLPGLIIDKYNDTYVLQVYSAGMERNIQTIIDILKNDLNAKNIFTKHDEYFRKLEGLNEEDSIYMGTQQEEIISDGKLKYRINFEKGQKTGFFFDQCDNREFFGKFCNDKTVLDCFCNSGGFGLHAAVKGASSVTFVDSSANEIENSKINFGLNDLNCKTEFICSDVFDYLEKCIAEKKKFDVVNIDPPAFAKSKKNLPKAIKAYEKLNKLAISLVKENGYVFSSSCSHHLKREDFVKLIGTAGVKAERNIQLVYFNGASLDHPSLPTMEETSYLKFASIRILG